MVTPEIASLIVQDIKLVILRLTIDRQGNLSLWPVPPLPAEGEDNTWNHSQRLAASLAEQKWIRLTSNRATGSYEPIKAQGDPGASLARQAIGGDLTNRVWRCAYY